MNLRQLFLSHVAQTSAAPLALEIIKAEGCVLIDASGKEYLDLIGGISVANVGHRHPKVVEAIKKQTDDYLHVMVYGEFVQSPQVQYAKLLTQHLPSSLDSVYFTNSGAEAVEGAMKLAKRATGRTEIIAFQNSYHGSTQGALSIIGDEYWRNAFRPLLPDIQHLRYNSFDDLKFITQQTACVIAETVQAEAGIIAPQKEWLRFLQERCTEVGALFILDEIQAGFGRTGKLWGFENFNVVPDVLLLGKALGGGLPLGAFIADKSLMDCLTDNPVLGHITTFGGHPLCCAAGKAAFEALLDEELFASAKEKEALCRSLLVHPNIKSLSSFGLWMAVEFESFEENKKIIDACIANGVLTDWFLFASNCLRISPPLTLSLRQVKQACEIILEALP
ncbi:aspartate aminotransferase family protein [Flavisolibacter ginsenosidimutans]|uniref:Aspartate aminotransferase family protein n=1 Tax=Flavisolibacter ginsenosidimutans TaxID=661481 RepID=A0A5B8UNA3_9BACT|nr:aminotransferase class III-fold pyridoxal phosphate-dependent enzyme [Flavisolibacter ginsenosidimutans]QEC57699.1 aspartate aminotransferase family protein [Flavisolibacter ginsenosidimutans]